MEDIEDIINNLRSELQSLKDERTQSRSWRRMREDKELIKRLTAERDEARRLYCMAQSHVDEEYGKTILPEDQAAERGWDCFKEDRK